MVNLTYCCLFIGTCFLKHKAGQRTEFKGEGKLSAGLSEFFLLCMYTYMTDHASPRCDKCNPRILLPGFKIARPDKNLCNPMINCVAHCAVFQKHNFLSRFAISRVKIWNTGLHLLRQGLELCQYGQQIIVSTPSGQIDNRGVHQETLLAWMVASLSLVVA